MHHDDGSPPHDDDSKLAAWAAASALSAQIKDRRLPGGVGWRPRGGTHRLATKCSSFGAIWISQMPRMASSLIKRRVEPRPPIYGSISTVASGIPWQGYVSAGLLAYRELDCPWPDRGWRRSFPRQSYRQERAAWHDGAVPSVGVWPARRIDDVNDADRLARDPAMRWIVGGRAIERQALPARWLGSNGVGHRENTEALAASTECGSTGFMTSTHRR